MSEPKSEKLKLEGKFYHWDPDAGTEEGHYHMDVGTRNQRLFNTLVKMGLVVYPHPDETTGEIDFLYVSTGLIDFET